MADPSDRSEPELTAAEGLWGGPVYSYRGAEIRCTKGGYVCALLMDEHPLNGHTFGVVGTITSLVDLWLDERRLPALVHKSADGRGAAAIAVRQAVRCDTGMPSRVIRLSTEQPTRASVFWAGRVRARRPRPMMVLYRNTAVSPSERLP